MCMRASTNEDYMATARQLCADWMNKNVNKLDGQESSTTANDMYIIRFCKTLQNWKALVSTDKKNEYYFEVTANCNKREIYLDVYEKLSDNCISANLIIFDNLNFENKC